MQLPDSLQQLIEDLAAREGYTACPFLANAAGEKLAVGLTMESRLPRSSDRLISTP